MQLILGKYIWLCTRVSINSCPGGWFGISEPSAVPAGKDPPAIPTPHRSGFTRGPETIGYSKNREWGSSPKTHHSVLLKVFIASKKHSNISSADVPGCTSDVISAAIGKEPILNILPHKSIICEKDMRQVKKYNNITSYRNRYTVYDIYI